MSDAHAGKEGCFMMDKKKGILGYFSQVFMLYGIIILFLGVSCKYFGEDGATISTIFAFGDKGLSISTMLEFFFAIAIIVLLRFVFMTDVIIKKMSRVLRNVAMLTGGLLVSIGFITAFEWFPVKDGEAWALFLVSFAVSCGISTFVAAVAEKQENKRLEEALQRYKEKSE